MIQPAVVDNFLDNYEDLKQLSLTCKFEDVVNPADGVTYPHIFKDIPVDVQTAVKSKLEDLFGKSLTINFMFMRMSPEGVRVPHIAHTDNSMGKYSLMLYLNEGSGTSFLKHWRTGICIAPADQSCVDLMSRDANNMEEWVALNTVESKENRACIFDAEYFHCAQPIGGFGKTQQDSRIVLTAFFDD